MSQENVEVRSSLIAVGSVVRAAYEEFSRGDFSARAELPDDFKFVASPELPDARAFGGNW